MYSVAAAAEIVHSCCPITNHSTQLLNKLCLIGQGTEHTSISVPSAPPPYHHYHETTTGRQSL